MNIIIEHYRHYVEEEKEFGPDFINIKQLLHVFNTLIIPMWLFLASGVATYIALGLHIIVRHETLKHILHSIVSSQAMSRKARLSRYIG